MVAEQRCAVSRVTVLSIEAESVGTQIGRECRAFGLGGLAGLVLGPAVERRLAKFGVGPLLLAWNGVQGIPPAVVIVDSARQFPVVVAVAVGRDAARQAQADVALGLRITETEPCDRENQIG